MTVAEPHARRPPRPVLAVRVGVTGSRRLDALPDDARAAIRHRIAEVLDAVREEVAAVAASAEARRVYGTGPDGSVTTWLRILSPLADGADRMVAEVATERGFRLEVALPFPRGDYARDFSPGSRAAFDRRIDHPEPPPVLALDGGRGDDQDRSYEAVGHLVVRNCDLLIAVWDGTPAKGPGGTADIVRFSARIGPPVWWIDATGAAPPRLIRSTTDLRWQERAPQGEEAIRRLRGEVLALLLAPPHVAHQEHRHHVIDRVLRTFGVHYPGGDPLCRYLGEQPLPQRAVWRLHARFLRTVGGPTAPSEERPPAPGDAGLSGYWEALYAPADRASIDYRDRYRSSYVWVFGLATVAVLCAIAALAHDRLKPAATALELAALLAIGVLVVLNRRYGWHGRWIAYRLLAELCRKLEALAALAWSLPPSDRGRVASGASPEAWVGWYFNAALRASPRPTGLLAGTMLEDARRFVQAKLIAGQVKYHEDRKRVGATAGRRLADWGEILFVLTLQCVFVKLVFLAVPGHGAHAVARGLGIVAAILPGLSAAAFGVRAYAELELLEQQSARMELVMREAGNRIGEMRLDRPLASQDLAAEVFDVASEMLQDVGGWADLFRLKAVEAG